ncbi:DUF4127 family protein [Leifsonia sp. NPDC056824]|uniref:DUF4127 family protein n=1 Tax=Leifsonia sp. NPDC056824 TaxID=3345953 RepID=UPI0036B58FAC
MRLSLVPLDERPVNVDLPRQVAAIAGVPLATPPSDVMPAMRAPAALGGLHQWMRDQAQDPATTHLIACVDTVVHGGIIPARISDDSTVDALGRLGIFGELRSLRPDLTVSAASLVVRASDSYSDVEEPEYWSTAGRELHRLGGDLHRALEREVAGADGMPGSVDCPIASDVVRDFELRRLRNHLVNLETLALHERGDLDTLAITADDTAPHSAGSAEQVWLRHWRRALPGGRSVMMYPGADEVGAVLVARALVSGAVPVFSVLCGEPDGLDRVPNFENLPLIHSVRRQVEAAGGVVADDGGHRDIALVVHAPDPGRGDCFGALPLSDPAAVERTVELVRAALDDETPVALADVRFSNGGDPLLVDRLAEEGLLLALSSYGGWNTAGNTIGGVVAQAAARWVGTRTGSLDAVAAERALLTRVLDDCAYQSAIRRSLHDDVFGGRIGPVEEAAQAVARERIVAGLQAFLTRVAPGSPWRVTEVDLPWARSFEIALTLSRD